MLVGLLDLGLAAKAHDRQQHAEPLIVLRPEHRLVLVEEHIAVPTAHAIPQRHRIQRHRPVGEGSGLVEANDIHGRERLERLEPPHQDVVSPQSSTPSEGGRGDHGQSLRDRRTATESDERTAGGARSLVIQQAEDSARRHVTRRAALQLAELPLRWRLRRHVAPTRRWMRRLRCRRPRRRGRCAVTMVAINHVTRAERTLRAPGAPDFAGTRP